MQTNKARCLLSITTLLSISPLYGSLWEVIRLVNNSHNYIGMKSALANFQDAYPDENTVLRKYAEWNQSNEFDGFPVNAPDETSSIEFPNRDTQNHVDTCIRKQNTILKHPEQYTSQDIAEVNKACNTENLRDWFYDQQRKRHDIIGGIWGLYNDPSPEAAAEKRAPGTKAQEKIKEQTKEAIEYKEKKRYNLEKYMGREAGLISQVHSPQFKKDAIDATYGQFLKRYSNWGGIFSKLLIGPWDAYYTYRNIR